MIGSVQTGRRTVTGMLDKEKLIEGLEMAKDVIDLWIPMFEQRSAPAFIEEAIAVLKSQPQIVRCKDCIHGGIDSASYPHFWCSPHSEYHESDWFCADGEPNGGDHS